jgi:hypothetical protein
MGQLVCRYVTVEVHALRWGLYPLNSIEPSLEITCFQPLNLKCDLLVSKFAFKLDLYRYAAGLCARLLRRGHGGGGMGLLHSC